MLSRGRWRMLMFEPDDLTRRSGLAVLRPTTCCHASQSEIEEEEEVTFLFGVHVIIVASTLGSGGHGFPLLAAVWRLSAETGVCR